MAYSMNSLSFIMILIEHIFSYEEESLEGLSLEAVSPQNLKKIFLNL